MMIAATAMKVSLREPGPADGGGDPGVCGVASGAGC